MAQKVRIIFILAAMLFVLSGCSRTETAVSPLPEPKKISVGMLIDELGLNELQLNASAYRGLKKAEVDLHMSIEILESKQKTDYEINLATLAQNGHDLILAVGSALAPALERVAKEHPNQKFGLIDAAFGDPNVSLKNVVWTNFREEEGSFLMGVIAAKMTKTNAVGFIGGVQTEKIKQREYGFRAGVAAVNPSIGILSGYAASFSDSSKTKALAKSMYSQEADVIYHAAQAAGKGLFEAAVERSQGNRVVWAIGDETDQNMFAPDNVLSSMIISAENAVYEIVRELAYGEWKGGQVLSFGLKDGVIDIAPTTNRNKPQEVVSAIDIFRIKITNAEIAVPKTKTDFDKYMLKLPK